jgi:hypothetical protein
MQDCFPAGFRLNQQSRSWPCLHYRKACPPGRLRGVLSTSRGRRRPRSAATPHAFLHSHQACAASDILRQNAVVLKYTSRVRLRKRAQKSAPFSGIARDVLAPLQLEVTKVGQCTRAWTDPHRTNWAGTGPRPLLTEVWYPAPDTVVESDIGVGPPEQPLFTAGKAARDAELVASPPHFPCLLLSHGTGGSALQLGWLGTALAAQGYIVAGVNHHRRRQPIVRNWATSFLRSCVVSTMCLPVADHARPSS